MSTSAATVGGIVDSNGNSLLKSLQDFHGTNSANVGISVALFYPEDSAVPSFFKYGSAGPGQEILADTVYGIGSVTKVFTSTLAAYLNVTGVIGDLGQTLVGPYLSNSACNPSAVSGPYWTASGGATFERFATQTSGMPDEANGPYSDQLFQDQPPSCDQLAWWNDNQSSFAADEGSWIYSSAGFVTLGFAVAGAAGAGGLAGGYTTLLKDIITSQVGMPNTFAADDVPAGAQLARGYDKVRSVPITGAADLKSTSTDMLAWLTAIYQAMKLQAEGSTMTPLQQAIASTTTTWISDPANPDKKPTGFAMGLGWQIPTIGNADVLTKNGSTSLGGCSCWVGLTRYSTSVPPVGIALLTNQIGVSPDATGHGILKDIIGLA